jgi:hypothetical protein
MGKKAPKVPNAAETTAEAAKVNAQTAAANQQFQTDAFKANVGAANNSNPFGYAGYNIDPNTGMPTGFSKGFSGPIQGGFDNVAGAFGQTTGLLPNFDMMTPQNIAMGNYNAYSAMAAPQRQQMQNQLKTTMAERGIPEFSQNGDFGSDIAKNAWGNLNQQFALADTNAAAQAWNAVPGMQAQMTNTELQQKYAPANQNLGLLQGLYGFMPGINQPQLGAASQANVDHSSNVWNAYNAEQKNAAAKQDGFNQLLKVGGTALGGFFGGPMGAMAMNGLMGGLTGGGAPQGFPQSGVWNPAPTNFNWGQS